MRIGIDISQIVHEGTGVGKYVREIVRTLIALNVDDEYILFGASLRKQQVLRDFYLSLEDKRRVSLKIFPIPPTVLDVVWNRLHIFPIEWFVGCVDVFWSSDWTQPPLARAKGITTIHDLIALKFPEETHNSTEFSGKDLNFAPNIHATHLRRLKWARKECEIFLCDSESTKKDLVQFMNIHQSKIQVIYPGFQPALE